MGFFDRFRRKQADGEATATGLTVMLPLGATPSREFRYLEFSREGYQQNATFGAGVRLISRSIACLPIKVFREVKDEEVQLPDHPVWNLLRRPNEWQSWKTWNDALWGHWALSGNVYDLAAGDPFTPEEMWLLRPDRVQIRLNQQGILVYEYQADGAKRDYDVQQIMHIKAFSPTSDFYGEPPSRSAAVSIDQDNLAAEWNVSLLNNQARPGLILEPPPNMPTMSKKQREALRKEFDDFYAGSKNSGKALILGGGFTSKEMGFNPKEMDWKQGRVMSQVQIALSLGVPPELVGIQGQKTFSNYQEARKSFYEETVIPLADMLTAELTNFLGWRWPKAGGKFVIAVDKDNVDALKESRDAKWERVGKAQDRGTITINEARNELGFEEIDGGDAILVPANRLPLAAVSPTDGGDAMPRMEEEE